MALKGALVAIVSLGVLAGCTSMDLKRGNKMPDLSSREITLTVLTPNNTMINYYSIPGSKKDSENWEYASVITTHPDCKPTMKPFAIQSFKKKEIYVDSNWDDEIDKVYRNAHETTVLRMIHTCKYQSKKA